MREAGVALAGPPFARYLAFEPRIRAEIGFPVQRPAPHVGRVFPGRLPGGRVASVVHIGSFDGLEHTYGLMHRWLAELGLRPTGPIWEVYWSDPEAEPDPATWRTEIFAPIEVSAPGGRNRRPRVRCAQPRAGPLGPAPPVQPRPAPRPFAGARSRA